MNECDNRWQKDENKFKSRWEMLNFGKVQTKWDLSKEF